MKNNTFAEEYKTYTEIRDRHEAAFKALDKEAIDAAWKEMRALYESIEAKGNDYARMYKRLEEAWDRGNDSIDLHDNIWDENVPAEIERLRNFGVERFTFSSTWSSAVKTAWLFTENGCSLEGITEINGSDPDEKLPAYLFSIN